VLDETCIRLNVIHHVRHATGFKRRPYVHTLEPIRHTQSVSKKPFAN
jgi:hypothetical protein